MGLVVGRGRAHRKAILWYEVMDNVDGQSFAVWGVVEFPAENPFSSSLCHTLYSRSAHSTFIHKHSSGRLTGDSFPIAFEAD